MDLNGDGSIDILSGSYSRMDGDMAGLFQVLWGKKDGTFAKAKALLGSDDAPLILPAGAGDQGVVEKICTRPFAADLNGDGKLDIVTGNFIGTFAWFAGEGGGKFSPKATWIESNGSRLKVNHHSDPFLVDWDGDGDFDLLSGSSEGGAYLFSNVGSKTVPAFASAVTLHPAPTHAGTGTQPWGDAAVQSPGDSTRVWAADVNGDGKLDLLLGDSAAVLYPAEGLDESTARERLTDWEKKQAAVQSSSAERSESDMETVWRDLMTAREKIIREDRTGFVWLLLRQ